MITRHGGVLLVALAMLLSACIARSEEAANPEIDVGSESPAVDADTMTAVDVELERLVDAGELDGVVRMLPPSGRPMSSGMGPTGTVVSQRPVLSFNTPTGLVEMFDVTASDPDMGQGLQRCRVVVEGNGMGASCWPAGEAPIPSVGIGGASGSDDSTLYELSGPSDMTHFIVAVGEQRLAVVAREGNALLFVPTGFCENPPSIESAWRGEEELVVTSNSSC